MENEEKKCDHEWNLFRSKAVINAICKKCLEQRIIPIQLLDKAEIKNKIRVTGLTE